MLCAEYNRRTTESVGTRNSPCRPLFQLEHSSHYSLTPSHNNAMTPLPSNTQTMTFVQYTAPCLRVPALPTTTTYLSRPHNYKALQTSHPRGERQKPAMTLQVLHAHHDRSRQMVKAARVIQFRRIEGGVLGLRRLERPTLGRSVVSANVPGPPGAPGTPFLLDKRLDFQDRAQYPRARTWPRVVRRRYTRAGPG